jgi:hypothetical protein
LICQLSIGLCLCQSRIRIRFIICIIVRIVHDLPTIVLHVVIDWLQWRCTRVRSALYVSDVLILLFLNIRYIGYVGCHADIPI